KDPGSRNAYALRPYRTGPRSLAADRTPPTAPHPRLQCPGQGVYPAASRLQPARITVLAPPKTRSAVHPQLTHIAAPRHIADLHRAAGRNRLVHTATTATSTRAVPRTPTRRRRASVVPVPAPPVAWLKRTRWWSRSSKR